MHDFYSIDRCGSGMSGEVITEYGHSFIGCDISKDMLSAGKALGYQEDTILMDMSKGLGFRRGIFDGIIR